MPRDDKEPYRGGNKPRPPSKRRARPAERDKIALLLPHHPDPIYVFDAVRQLRLQNVAIDIVVATYPMCTLALGIVLDLAYRPRPHLFGSLLAEMMQEREFWQMSGFSNVSPEAGDLKHRIRSKERPSFAKTSEWDLGRPPAGGLLRRFFTKQPASWKEFIRYWITRVVTEIDQDFQGDHLSDLALADRVRCQYQMRPPRWPGLILLGTRWLLKECRLFRFPWLPRRAIHRYCSRLMEYEKQDAQGSAETDCDAFSPIGAWCANTLSQRSEDAQRLFLDALVACSLPWDTPLPFARDHGRTQDQFSGWRGLASLPGSAQEPIRREVELQQLDREARFAGTHMRVALTHDPEPVVPIDQRCLMDRAAASELIQLLRARAGRRDDLTPEQQERLRKAERRLRTPDVFPKILEREVRDLSSDPRQSIPAEPLLDSLARPSPQQKALAGESSAAPRSLYVIVTRGSRQRPAVIDPPVRQLEAVLKELGFEDAVALQQIARPGDTAWEAALSAAAQATGRDDRLVVIGYPDEPPGSEDKPVREADPVIQQAGRHVADATVPGGSFSWCATKAAQAIAHLSVVILATPDASEVALWDESELTRARQARQSRVQIHIPPALGDPQFLFFLARAMRQRTSLQEAFGEALQLWLGEARGFQPALMEPRMVQENGIAFPLVVVADGR